MLFDLPPDTFVVNLKWIVFQKVYDLGIKANRWLGSTVTPRNNILGICAHAPRHFILTYL